MASEFLRIPLLHCWPRNSGEFRYETTQSHQLGSSRHRDRRHGHRAELVPLRSKILLRAHETVPGDELARVGRQNKVGSFQRRTLQSCYKNGLMLGLIWGVFTWLRSFIRSRHDLGLEIVALRQQLMVLKRRTKRTAFSGSCCAECGRNGPILF